MGRVAEPKTVSRRGESSEASRGDRVIVTSGYWRIATLTLSAVTLALIGSFVSCGGGDSGSSAVNGSSVVNLKSFLNSWEAAISTDCNCQFERGWWGTGASNDCVTDSSPSSASTLTCLEDVAKANGNVEKNLECAKEKETALETCLSGSDCSEDAYNTCLEAYYLAYANCTPMITDEAFRQLNDCF